MSYCSQNELDMLIKLIYFDLMHCLFDIKFQAKYDITSFLFEFGRQHSYEIQPGSNKNYKLNGIINPPNQVEIIEYSHGVLSQIQCLFFQTRSNSLVHQYSQCQGIRDSFPAVCTSKSIRIYVSRDGKMAPLTHLTLQ